MPPMKQFHSMILAIVFRALIVYFLVLIPATARADVAGEAIVVDGDTLKIKGQRVRLWGIDAPETRQNCQRNSMPWQCGKDATEALSAKIKGKSINCQQRDRDRYKRIVAICFLGSENLNAWMVSEGWALDYRQYSKGRYLAQETAARSAKKGIWSSRFLKPWEWRRNRRG
jgi:endonuclease YncB( thermonuclease family)